MKTYFSRLAGRFQCLNKIQLEHKGKLVIGFMGNVQANTINVEELNYLTSWYVDSKYKLEHVEVLKNYSGIMNLENCNSVSKFPTKNYNSFLKITYEPINKNIPESEYAKIQEENHDFKWNHEYKENITTSKESADIER